MVQTLTLGFQQKCQFIEVYGSNSYLGVPTQWAIEDSQEEENVAAQEGDLEADLVPML
jgi:hypothetical protein